MTDEEQKGLATITQVLTPDSFKENHDNLIHFVKSQLKKTDSGINGDYGVIPYTKKMSLLKPGAEKLAKLFGLVPSYEKVSEVEDWAGKFVFYKYKCTLTHFATGKKVGDATRSCNNKEKKHADKSVYDVANTIDAVAQKRALVAAVVMATNASDIFDADGNGEYEEQAPNRPIKRDEDPRRASLCMKLYGSGKTRGFTDPVIHALIKKKWSVDSITQITNQQIEELTEFIVTNYVDVPAGEKPKMRGSTVKVEEKPEKKEEVVVEGEVVNVDVSDVEEEVYYCRGPKHEGKDKVLTTQSNPWCSAECQEAYWGKSPVKTNARMEAFLKTGKLPPTSVQ